MEESLYFKESDNTLYVRAVGHVTANLCPDLKQLVIKRFEELPIVKGLFIDLSECDYMDSTFMGLLLGFNKRCQQKIGKKAEILNPTEECRKLLKGLGVIQILEIINKNIVMPMDMSCIRANIKATANFLLNTHEELMECSDSNRERFALLHSMLRKQVFNCEDKVQ